MSPEGMRMKLVTFFPENSRQPKSQTGGKGSDLLQRVLVADDVDGLGAQDEDLLLVLCTSNDVLLQRGQERPRGQALLVLSQDRLDRGLDRLEADLGEAENLSRVRGREAFLKLGEDV